MPVDYERFRRTGDRIPQYGKQMQRSEMTNFEVMIVKSENGKKRWKYATNVDQKTVFMLTDRINEKPYLMSEKFS